MVVPKVVVLVEVGREVVPKVVALVEVEQEVLLEEAELAVVLVRLAQLD